MDFSTTDNMIQIGIYFNDLSDRAKYELLGYLGVSAERMGWKNDFFPMAIVHIEKEDD